MAGVMAIQGHLDDRGEIVSVQEQRNDIDDAPGRVMVGAAIVAMLASNVLEAFGVDNGNVNDLAEKLQRLAEVSSPE